LRRHFAQQVDGAFDIRAKALVGIRGIFAQVRGEMDYDVVGRHARSIQLVEDIKVRAPREIFSVEEAAHVRAEVTTTACN
jgi:hypothetical protein